MRRLIGVVFASCALGFGIASAAATLPADLTEALRLEIESMLVSGKREPETYDDADRARACTVIRSVAKPCLAFKVLAAGRKPKEEGGLREAFEYVLGHIKPTDALVVGMFPKHSDQIAENAALVRELCAVL